ncbi:MAG: hypothetical protein WB559_08740 [Candidatus Acidiferrales bacterium]
MKNCKILASSLALAAMLAMSSTPARAQAAEIAKIAVPIVVKIINAVAEKGSKPKDSNWLKAEVVHADSNSIIVREQQNGMAIHTFNFSPEMRDQMQTILDQGGFQYGDKISILYMPGQTVALRIHGKPSKPL